MVAPTLGVDIAVDPSPSVMTNSELGRLLKVSPSYASRLRHGLRKPSLEVAMRISEKLGIDYDTVLTAIRRGPDEFSNLMEDTIRELVEAGR